ncbi:hypothetical protein HDV05_005667 [Chytridiales sp. JEL 0842]|nr:hypothetical protein HDV05_005667 [Chytridiales sp. JEL 0842]
MPHKTPTPTRIVIPLMMMLNLSHTLVVAKARFSYNLQNLVLPPMPPLPSPVPKSAESTAPGPDFPQPPFTVLSETCAQYYITFNTVSSQCFGPIASLFPAQNSGSAADPVSTIGFGVLPAPIDSVAQDQICTGFSACYATYDVPGLLANLTASCVGNPIVRPDIIKTLATQIDFFKNVFCSKDIGNYYCYNTTYQALSSSHAVLFDPLANTSTPNYLAAPLGFPAKEVACNECVNTTLTLVSNSFLPFAFNNDTTLTITKPTSIAFGNTCNLQVERNVTTANNTLQLVNVTLSFGGEVTPAGPTPACQDSWTRFRLALMRCTLPLESLYPISNPSNDHWSGSFGFEPIPETAPRAYDHPTTSTVDNLSQFLAPFTFLNTTLLSYGVPLLCDALEACDAQTNLTFYFNATLEACTPTAEQGDALSRILVKRAKSLYGDVKGVTCSKGLDVVGPKNATGYCFPDFADNAQAIQNKIYPVIVVPLQELEDPNPNDEDTTTSSPGSPSGPRMGAPDIYPPIYEWQPPSLNGSTFCGPCQTSLYKNLVTLYNETLNNTTESEIMQGQAEGIRRFACGGGSKGLDSYTPERACSVASTQIALIFGECELKSSIPPYFSLFISPFGIPTPSACVEWKRCFSKDRDGWSSVEAIDKYCKGKPAAGMLGVEASLLWNGVCMDDGVKNCYSAFVETVQSIAQAQYSNTTVPETIARAWCTNPCIKRQKKNLGTYSALVGMDYLYQYLGNVEEAVKKWERTAQTYQSAILDDNKKEHEDYHYNDNNHHYHYSDKNYHHHYHCNHWYNSEAKNHQKSHQNDEN